MGYKNYQAIIRQQYPQTRQIKHCKSSKFVEHNNTFGEQNRKLCKGLSPGSSIVNIKDTQFLSVLIIDSRNHPLLKNDLNKKIFTFLSRGTFYAIQLTYCDYFNMKYVARSQNNSPRQRSFPVSQINNDCILSIVSQKLTTIT